MRRVSMGIKMMSKFVWVLFILPFMLLATNYNDMSKYDVSDTAKKKSFSIDMIICSATFGTHHGLYIRQYKGDEKHKTCVEFSPRFKHLIIKPYAGEKRISGAEGSMGFGKIPNQCYIELSVVNGQMTGTPYGNKGECAGIRSDGTVVLEKPKKQTPKKKKVVDAPYVMQILKYGSSHGIGQSFPSKSQCDVAQVRLSKENAGLDYTYKCVKK